MISMAIIAVYMAAHPLPPQFVPIALGGLISGNSAGNGFNALVDDAGNILLDDSGNTLTAN